MAEYEPFLIGTQKTGLYQYLRPWMAPQDAWVSMQNAFIYRGVLSKRNGIVPFDCTISLTTIPLGTTTSAIGYSGTVLAFPIVAGTFEITIGSITFSDEGNGLLIGSPGGQGTINYFTGAWAITLVAPVTPAIPITVSYEVSNSHLQYQDYLGAGDGATATFTGTLPVHPIVGGTFTPSDGTETFTDSGNGTISSMAGGTGTINYQTGAYSITFHTAPGAGVPITVLYSPAVTNGTRPIMGLKQWTNETTGVTTLVAFDTRRASAFNDSMGCFQALASVSQTLWVDDGSTTNVPLNVNWSAVAPYTQALAPFTVTISYTGYSTTDNGSEGFADSGVIENTTTVNYTTGAIDLMLSANSAGRVFTVTFTLVGDYFTGTVSNFFNSTNWMSLLYVVNNADPITTFNGTTLARPPFGITQADVTAFVNNIATALDVEVYKNRFLVLSPSYTNNAGNNGIQPQTVAYSAINNAVNLAADVPGNGGFIEAGTDDFIQAAEFLRDQLIIFFQRSTWLFRFTGSSFDPFRFDRLNNSKNTNAPYGSIGYDERATSMGNKGLIACDGVNVQRYDLQIIDEFLEIDQNNFKQAYGTRFDSINQSWMLYPSKEDQDIVAGVKLSDKALVYNFLENTWSIYDFTLPSEKALLNCLGVYHQVTDKIWSDFPAPATPPPIPPQPPFLPNSWGASNFSWNNYLLQNQAPILLGGGQDGQVYELDDEETYTDNGNPIVASVTSTQWNPYVGKGQRIQFGWIDLYYDVIPSDDDEEEAPNPASNPILNLEFFVNNSTTPIDDPKIITLDTSIPGATQAMKRIYVNAIGEFLQMQITSDGPTPFNILGLIIWARPAGRLTP